MSAAAVSSRPSPVSEVDAAVAAVRRQASKFATLPVAAKAELLRATIPTLLKSGPDWVAAGCRNKGIEPGTPLEGEEWVTGPMITIRAARLLAETLEAIARTGEAPLGTGHRLRPDGRLEIDVFPASRLDAVLYSGYTAQVLMEKGLTLEAARRRQAAFYKQPGHQGRVCAVLGAGNVSAIPPTDVFTKLFAEGAVCVLKMNPVNEWLGPILERGLQPLITAGYLRIVYGAGDVGARLAGHPDVDEVHITGSEGTYQKVRESAAGKRITTELGNVSPVIVTPAEYSEKALRAQAGAVATMVANNASFNCNAAKVLVTGKAWPQRERFLALIRSALAATPARSAYYPGAEDRYSSLLEGRGAEKLGQAGPGQLPWALVSGLDPEDRDERLFKVEPFCGILSETALEEAAPERFLARATQFCNDRLWGTLNAMIVIPKGLAVPALEKAIEELRYGTVGVNVWPAVSYALMTAPWGGHPSASEDDIQSGLGWVHNTFLLEGIEKAVVRGPLVPPLKPAWSHDARQTHRMGPRLAALEAAPSWAKTPPLVGLALRS